MNIHTTQKFLPRFLQKAGRRRQEFTHKSRFNIFLDKLVRPDIHILHKPRSSFHVCGYTGLILAIVQSMILAVYGGLSPWILTGIIGVAILTFLGLVMSTKIITGEEQIIYYYHRCHYCFRRWLLCK